MASVDLVTESPDRVAGASPEDGANGSRRAPGRYRTSGRASERRRARPPGRGASLGARCVGAGTGSTRPGRAARGAVGDAGAGTGTRPLRTDAGLPVHVLPWSRLSDGCGSRSRAQNGPPRPALRRRPSFELRGFASPDRRLVFGVNDFDETLPGPFEWDVKRLVASFAVAGRDRGFDSKQRRSINTAVARAYREAMRSYADMGNMDVWYAHVDVEEFAELAARQATAKQVSASRRTSRRHVPRTA